MTRNQALNLLEIGSEASLDDINAAYRKAAFKYHPDRNKEKDAVEKFKSVQQAFDLLTKPNSNPTESFQDVFWNVFSMFQMRQNKAKPFNKVVKTKVELSVADLFKKSKSIIVEINYKNCEECNGTKTVVSSKICSKCNGKKNIYFKTGGLNVQKECNYCDKSGYEFEECKKCDQYGHIAMKQKIPLEFNFNKNQPLFEKEFVLSTDASKERIQVKFSKKPDDIFDIDKEYNLIGNIDVNYLDVLNGKNFKLNYENIGEIEINIPPKCDIKPYYIRNKGIFDKDLIFNLNMKYPENVDLEFFNSNKEKFE